MVIKAFPCIFCARMTTAIHSKLGPICAECLGLYDKANQDKFLIVNLKLVNDSNESNNILRFIELEDDNYRNN